MGLLRECPIKIYPFSSLHAVGIKNRLLPTQVTGLAMFDETRVIRASSQNLFPGFWHATDDSPRFRITIGIKNGDLGAKQMIVVVK